MTLIEAGCVNAFHWYWWYKMIWLICLMILNNNAVNMVLEHCCFVEVWCDLTCGGRHMPVPRQNLWRLEVIVSWWRLFSPVMVWACGQVAKQPDMWWVPCWPEPWVWHECYCGMWRHDLGCGRWVFCVNDGVLFSKFKWWYFSFNLYYITMI